MLSWPRWLSGAISAQPGNEDSWQFSEGEYGCLKTTTDKLDYCFQILDRCSPQAHQLPRKAFRERREDCGPTQLDTADGEESLDATLPGTHADLALSSKRAREIGPELAPVMATGMDEDARRPAARRRDDEYGPMMECLRQDIKEELGNRANKLENDVRDHASRIAQLERGARP